MKQILFVIIIIFGISIIPDLFAEANWENLEVNIIESERISSRTADVILVEADFKNQDDENIQIHLDNIALNDSKNQEYSNSIFYNLLKKGHDVTQEDCPWGESLDLNPGVSLKTKFCFEVPKENVSFILHIYDNDIDLCKNQSSEECQEKLIRVSVDRPEGVSFTESKIVEPPIKSRGDITITPGANISGCEENMSCYVPYRFDAGKGSIISWHNVDSDAHTVTSGTPSHGKTDNFDSGVIPAGSIYSHKFDKVDVVNYFCTIHPWMTGLLNISRSDAVIGNNNDMIDLVIVPKIPEWVKNTMQWYLDGAISEDEMILAIQYLANEGIIKLD